MVRPLLVRLTPLLLSLTILVQALAGGALPQRPTGGTSLDAALAVLCTPTGVQDHPDGSAVPHDRSCCLLHCRLDLTGGTPLSAAPHVGIIRFAERADALAVAVPAPCVRPASNHTPRGPPVA
ncbi:hypothetical protein [Elstera sp.]|uniref:hypothetical protein n=1 Tax=Elstera sp. TaxID=1916664 RepID=UPI0037BF0FF9